MQIKRIICPKCRAVLDVKNSKNEEVKIITCPSCKTGLKVKFPPQQEPVEAKTFLSGQPTAGGGTTQLGGLDGRTVLGGGIGGSTVLGPPNQDTSVTARLTFGGKDYPLNEGQNIVGRQGTTSMATVLAATVVAPKGAPCRVRNMANAARDPATMYPTNMLKNRVPQTTSTVLRGKLSTI